MEILINENRLNRAVQEINREYGLTHKGGHYENRLRAGHGRAIVKRMNELRLENKEWHSALQMAAAAQKGISDSRRALYRRAISLYGRWTYKALLASGYRGPLLAFYRGSELEEPEKVGGIVMRSCTKDGQLTFIS